MKKVLLFSMSIFAMGVSLAQSVSDWDFVPPTTDNNMSVVFPTGTLTDFTGGFLMAFVDGVPASASSEIAADGSGGVAVIGTDNLCGCDLADGGESISFAILLDGTIIVITDVDPPVTYAANSFHMISSEVIEFNIDGNPVVFGCMDATYMEYNAAANAPDNAECINSIVTGCMDVLADNYNAEANVGSECFFTGCMDVFADNYLANANVAGDCIFFGCMDATACNYDDGANTDDLSCVGLFGCTNNAYYEYNEAATCDDATCSALIVPGCEDDTMFNYNASATEDDGSCYPVILGCVNPSADNYIQPIDDVMVDANSDDVPTLCTYSGLNPWGPGAGAEEAPTYFSSNNMSVLFPVGNSAWGSSDLITGDILFAAYETSTLENETYGYSEIASMESAGAVVWTGEQIGMSIFGSDGNADFNSGFEENESLTWLVKSDGVIYNAAVTFVNPSVNGLYDDGDYILIQSVSKGAAFYDGCTEATSPNFNPMANTPDGSCETPYSIGCMDENKVNYAGPGANPTHVSASNLGNPFGENLGYDLITGAQLNTGIAANVSNDDMCQDQVAGCTDPMAINYDPMATVNTITCDWTIGGMVVYNVDEDGFMIESDDNYVFADDFEHYATLVGAGAIDEDAHIAENVASIMEWIEGDEAADALELSTTITTMQNDYDVNENSWTEMFIADEIADSLELATTITTMQDAYNLNESNWMEMFTADEIADSLELATTISDAQDLLDITVANALEIYNEAITDYTDQLEVAANNAVTAATLATQTLNTQIETDALTLADTVTALTETIDYYSAPIVINLKPQWNTVGYYLHHPSPVVAQFEDQFGSDINDINIVKNNEGSFYWPEFGYDGLVMLEPGQGYQVRIRDGAEGKPDFIFDLNFTEDDLRLLTPTVPTWAIDMELEAHPNDIRTLVRVVNMLGQEVNPTEQFNGEVLLYMYNDGTVEKKMVE
jgi:hypothetical protein